MTPVLRVWLFIAATVMSAQLLHDSPRSTSGKSHVSASVNQNNMRKHNCQTHTDMQLCTIAAVESRGLSFCVLAVGP